MISYLRATTLDDALRFRSDHPDYTVLAGGTDLFVAAPSKPDPVGIIDVFGTEGLTGITTDADGMLVIGAATTYKDIVSSAMVLQRVPILAEASREIGALQIQSRGTIGGNMATSSPVGDTLPVLLATDARVRLASATSTRVVAYQNFITGYRKTALKADELIVSIEIPEQPKGALLKWRKVGTRRAQSISKVMFAGAAVVDKGVVSHLRLAFGAVADRPVRATAAEQAALGRPLDASVIENVRAAVVAQLRPIDDVRSSAAYRLKVAENLAGRFVADLPA